MSIKTTCDITRTEALRTIAQHYTELLVNLQTKSNDELGDLLDRLADNNEAGLSVFNNFIVINDKPHNQ